MIDTIRRLLGLKVVEPNQVWALVGTIKNPFETHEVFILDKKNGYVKYCFLPTTPFDDGSSKNLLGFYILYRFVRDVYQT